MAIPKFELSVDGIELQLATNHLGHYLLTRLLLPVLEKSQPSRIINVSSTANQMAPRGGVLWEKYNDPKSYSPWMTYGQSKFCNIAFTKELQRRIDANGNCFIILRSKKDLL